MFNEAPTQSPLRSLIIKPQLTVIDAGSIYAEIIRNLANMTYENHPLYIAMRSDSEPYVRPALTAAIQDSIMQNLDDLSADIVWVGLSKEVLWENGQIKGGGSQIFFGSIEVIGATQVQVVAGIYYGNVGANGGTFIIEKYNDQWDVTGVSNMWVS
ncbi:MAG: hypothetical protein R2911_22340 [Caldilineaceae bacterium]